MKLHEHPASRILGRAFPSRQESPGRHHSAPPRTPQFEGHGNETESRAPTGDWQQDRRCTGVAAPTVPAESERERSL